MYKDAPKSNLLETQKALCRQNWMYAGIVHFDCECSMESAVFAYEINYSRGEIESNAHLCDVNDPAIGSLSLLRKNSS